MAPGETTASPSAAPADSASDDSRSEDLDALLVPLAGDSELSRASGKGQASNVLDVGSVSRVHLYGACQPGRGAPRSAPGVTVRDDSGKDLTIVCDGVVTRIQLVDAMRGSLAVKADPDTQWSLLLAVPPWT